MELSPGQMTCSNYAARHCHAERNLVLLHGLQQPLFAFVQQL